MNNAKAMFTIDDDERKAMHPLPKTRNLPPVTFAVVDSSGRQFSKVSNRRVVVEMTL